MRQFSRTEKLIGKDNMEKLSEAHIAIFGLGGVGSFTAEGLVRCGISNFTLIDFDKVDVTNINRQIHANLNTIDLYKVELMEKRMKAINSKIKVNTFKEKYLPGKSKDMLNLEYDYVVDAIDMVTSKIDLIVKCNENSIPIISSMGTGNKLNPTHLEVDDIYNTSVCPLAKVMRKELRNKGIEKLKVVYSKEIPLIKNRPPASISFVPSVAGMILASEVVKDICGLE